MREVEVFDLPAREFAALRAGERHGRHKAKADAVAHVIDELGLEPLEPAAPLPPINSDDIHLICWMAVEAAQQRNSALLEARRALLPSRLHTDAHPL